MNDGGSNGACTDFPGGAPAGTTATQSCVQIHASDEDTATRLLAAPRPLNEADRKLFLWNVASVPHESQHNLFDAHASTVVSADVPGADCHLDTVVPSSGLKVEAFLSEISAETREFDVYFLDHAKSGGWALQTEEHDISIRGQENILGNIKDIQCVCKCDTTAKFVEQVFNDAAAAWTAPDKDAEKKEFNMAMTDFMPSFWPKSLQVKRP